MNVIDASSNNRTLYACDEAFKKIKEHLGITRECSGVEMTEYEKVVKP